MNRDVCGISAKEKGGFTVLDKNGEVIHAFYIDSIEDIRYHLVHVLASHGSVFISGKDSKIYVGICIGLGLKHTIVLKKDWENIADIPDDKEVKRKLKRKTDGIGESYKIARFALNNDL